jgi:hypothetical protein
MNSIFNPSPSCRLDHWVHAEDGSDNIKIKREIFWRERLGLMTSPGKELRQPVSDPGGCHAR